MKKIFKLYSNGIVFGLGVLSIIFVGYFLTKARNGIVASPGDKLTATKWNESLVHSYASQRAAADFSITTASRNTDPQINASLAVKNNDLVFVILDGVIYASASSVSPNVKLSLISGPGTFLSNISQNTLNQHTVAATLFTPFSISALIKATGDGTLNLGYQGYCTNPGTCIFRSVELKAFVVGKYQ